MNMKWYDIIAPIYDKAIRSLYLPYRQKIIQSLQLQPGQTVLDLGCGSGLNFELIIDVIGPQGILIGVDFSAKMLQRAQETIDLHGWKNVFLLQQDAAKINIKELNIQSRSDIRIDRILCTLGLSVFPDWQNVFEKSYNLLESNGKFGIMDLYNNKRTFQTRMVNFLADSDISRKVWEPLQKISANYIEERLPLMHGAEVVIIATGNKL
ncbi:MAG: methyltransferase domain-containing protein [Bacteroidetes bacterium]|nr:methyltransferase domain-containing protein [Bacteroidota bacterium]